MDLNKTDQDLLRLIACVANLYKIFVRLNIYFKIFKVIFIIVNSQKFFQFQNLVLEKVDL